MKTLKVSFTNETISLSALMTAYQRARKAIRSGVAKIEIGRLNRALGLVMGTTRDPRPYFTTINSCTCDDHQFRGAKFICKHRLAMMLVEVAQNVMGAE